MFSGVLTSAAPPKLWSVGMMEEEATKEEDDSNICLAFWEESYGVVPDDLCVITLEFCFVFGYNSKVQIVEGMIHLGSGISKHSLTSHKRNYKRRVKK